MLGLNSDVPGWWRGWQVAFIGLATFNLWVPDPGWKARNRRAVGVALIVASIVYFASALLGPPNVYPASSAAGLIVITAVFASSLSITVTRAFTGASAVAVAFIFTLFASDAVGPGPGAIAVAGASAVAGAALSLLVIKHQLQGLFLWLFLPAMVLAYLACAAFLSPLKRWGVVGPLLLFPGLLTLLNAPFDWTSLGLTRALLRRGLELGGWWPYLLALVDACLAGVIIALLAFVMVLGVQAFDELAAHGGGEKAAVLPLPALFDGIDKNPAAPEYWWAYALLLSSMIPSLINLMISGMALARGMPWLARLLLRWIPEGKAVPEYKRQPAAIGLTVQMFAGASLGIAAQAFLAWGLVFHVMPWIGLDLLGMARAVTAFDLPMRIGQLFAGTL
jgi:hypothetical protein